MTSVSPVVIHKNFEALMRLRIHWVAKKLRIAHLLDLVMTSPMVRWP